MDIYNMKKQKQIEAARDYNTPENLLRELAHLGSYGVRLNVAKNPSTPIDVLQDLSKDLSWGVRYRVAQNPNTPIDVLRELAKDEDEGVRWRVVQNPKASSKILVSIFEYEKSLKEPDSYVIKNLYENKNLPHIAKVILETLFGGML